MFLATQRRPLLGLAVAAALFAAISCSSSSSPTTAADAGDGGSADGGSSGSDAGYCGPLGCQPDLSDASLGVRATALLGGCAGGPESTCHISQAAGLHFPNTPENLVNVPSTEEPQYMRVAPGAPHDSYLYMKVTADPRIDGGQMPLGMTPLGPADLQLLRDWIEAGAPRQ